MMDSAAEVVDAPLLLLRIAQSRAEATRLVDWIRGAGALPFPYKPRCNSAGYLDTHTCRTNACLEKRLTAQHPTRSSLRSSSLRAGLGSEGQISHALMRRALAAIGVHSPTLSEQIDECFRVLDPEATGTISFSELHAELRRVRKLLTPANGYGPGSRPGSGKSMSSRPGSGKSTLIQILTSLLSLGSGRPPKTVRHRRAPPSTRKP